jgi:hypothetical protein
MAWRCALLAHPAMPANHQAWGNAARRFPLIAGFFTSVGVFR